MKKITLLMCAVVACMLRVNAQEAKFVSTEQQKKNVFIEEFTGRLCGYCPYGQVFVNQLVDQYPERVFTANIHAQSSLSPTSYPNLNTTPGAEVYMTYNSQGGIPAVVVNRMQAPNECIHPASCSGSVTSQLGQDADVNIAGQVAINPETRTATITVEAYYTKNSASNTNYLTIYMLQDSILGEQAGAANFNPEQMIGEDYVHMHTIRDIVTSTWGDEITATTAGTLVTKTYEYQIPEVIGSPNGVEVDLNNVHFIAFMTEKQQGAVTSPILNVAGLPSVMVLDKDFNPYFKTITVENNVSCSTLKPITLELVNGGKQEVTSLKYEAEVKGVTTQYTWEGSLPSLSSTTIEEELSIPVGKQKIEFRIVEVNGNAHEYVKSFSLTSEEWTEVYFMEEEQEFKVDIVQDRHGNQITWEIIASDNTVLASGGPYSALAANGVKLNRKKVVLPNNECVKFVIYDEGGDGFNNGAGEGSYKITDSKGNIIVEGDGKFGSEIYYNLSLKVGHVAVEEMTNDSYGIFPNPVKDVLTIVGDNMRQITIFNAMGQLVRTMDCDGNTVKVNVDDMQNGMYFVNVIDHNGEISTSKISVLH